MIANEKEFNEALKQLGQLYESGKIKIQDLQYGRQLLSYKEEQKCYHDLYDIIREMRDLAATTMQKLHWKIEN